MVGQIFISMLECLRGQIDGHIPRLLELIVRQLERNHKESDRRVRSMLLQVIAMLLYYSTPLVLSLLGQQEGLTEKIFDQLHKHLIGFKLDFEMRRALFGLTAVLISDSLPSLIEKNLASFFEAAAQVAIRATQLMVREEKKDKKKEAKEGKS